MADDPDESGDDGEYGDEDPELHAEMDELQTEIQELEVEVETSEEKLAEVQELADEELDFLAEEHEQEKEGLKEELHQSEEDIAEVLSEIQAAEQQKDGASKQLVLEGQQQAREQFLEAEAKMQEEVADLKSQILALKDIKSQSMSLQGQITTLTQKVEEQRKLKMNEVESFRNVTRGYEKESEIEQEVAENSSEAMQELDDILMLGKQMDRHIRSLEDRFSWAEKHCEEEDRDRRTWQKHYEQAVDATEEYEEETKLKLETTIEQRRALEDKKRISEMSWYERQRKMEDESHHAQLAWLDDRRKLEAVAQAASLKGAEVKAELQIARAKSEGLEMDHNIMRELAMEDRDSWLRRRAQQEQAFSEKLFQLMEESAQARQTERKWAAIAERDFQLRAEMEGPAMEARTKCQSLSTQKEQHSIGRLKAQQRLIDIKKGNEQLQVELRCARREARSLRNDSTEILKDLERYQHEERLRNGESSSASTPVIQATHHSRGSALMADSFASPQSSPGHARARTDSIFSSSAGSFASSPESEAVGHGGTGLAAPRGMRVPESEKAQPHEPRIPQSRIDSHMAEGSRDALKQQSIASSLAASTQREQFNSQVTAMSSAAQEGSRHGTQHQQYGFHNSATLDGKISNIERMLSAASTSIDPKLTFGNQDPGLSFASRAAGEHSFRSSRGGESSRPESLNPKSYLSGDGPRRRVEKPEQRIRDHWASSQPSPGFGYQ
eukprot:gnl/MRDRNA2_/MRDRNA2_90432_c0_seq1.p1 gnl/MRDRNA2_/MRDRNA2_90432_c0~~gnl/MRDRNA2_/MRDRNA2_90432_c0_seq1.p1  ORF type:complete len:727 (+),score=213.95 gnl/MRDRNA2_/MRDRNA2_90432_c0_seq1:50-2230(+)